MAPLRIAVTGGTGNVGTALLARLSSMRETYEVVAVARRVPPSIGPYRHACWHAVDVGDSDAEEMLCRAFDAADAVVHLAWGFQPSHRPDLLRRTAIGGTRAVMAAAARAGVAHVVHAADVATAVEHALAAPGAGVVNLAAADPVRAADVVESLHARPWTISRRTLRILTQATWRAHLQPVHGGWIDLLYDTPLLDCDRAERVLDWSPAIPGREVWRETIAGMRFGASGTGPVLGARSPREMIAALVAGGTVGRRPVP